MSVNYIENRINLQSKRQTVCYNFYEMDFVEIIGYVATVIAILMFLPQVIKTVKTKETKDLSVWMPILVLLQGSMWVAYGFLNGSYPIAITNIGIGIQAIILLQYK